MPTKTTKRKPTRARTTESPDTREDVRRELARQHRREKLIQRLAKSLNREMSRSNDMLQHLGVVLASRARAIEAERESAAAIER